MALEPKDDYPLALELAFIAIVSIPILITIVAATILIANVFFGAGWTYESPNP